MHLFFIFFLLYNFLDVCQITTRDPENKTRLKEYFIQLLGARTEEVMVCFSNSPANMKNQGKVLRRSTILSYWKKKIYLLGNRMIISYRSNLASSSLDLLSLLKRCQGVSLYNEWFFLFLFFFSLLSCFQVCLIIGKPFQL